MMRRLACCLLAAAVALLASQAPRPALAHAALLRAEPAPDTVLPAAPPQITLWFTEPLEPAFSEIQLFNEAGERVDSGDSRVHEDDAAAMSVSLPPLPVGAYTVSWRNLSSVDGHSLAGTFRLVIGEAAAGAAPAEIPAAPEQTPLEAAVRGLILIGALTIGGGMAFARLVVHPTFFVEGAGTAVGAVGMRILRRMRALMWAGWLLLAAGLAAQLLLQGTALYGQPLGSTSVAQLTGLVRETTWGQLWLWRALLILVLAFTMDAPMIARKRSPAEEDPAGSPLTALLALLAAAVFLLLLSLSSHGAAAGALRPAALFSDYLHLLAAALWVGGLFHFALGARPLYTGLPAAERRELLGVLLPRFSAIGLLSTGTLAITGLYATWVHVGAPQALVTPYGLTLLAKVALLLPMLALGAGNLLRSRRSADVDERSAGQLRRAVSAEALLGLAILLAAGLLTSLEPARQSAARAGIGQAQQYQEQAGRSLATLTVMPGRPGPNQLLVELEDALGRPVANASEVALELSYQEAAVATTRVVALPEREGRYLAKDVQLGLAGDWHAELLVRRPDDFDGRAEFHISVGHIAGAGPSAETGFLLWGVELTLLGFLFLSASLLPLRRWYVRPGVALAVAGGVALLAGVYLVMRATA
jgi:copper transport protein